MNNAIKSLRGVRAMSEHDRATTTDGPPAWVAWLRACAIIVCVCLYVLNLHSLQIGHHVDDGAYVSLGRSLNSGLGYVRFADPTHPPELQYPPAFALMVAGVLREFGDNIEYLRYISLAFSILSLLLADAFFHRRLSHETTGSHLWHPIALALFGLNHLIVGYAGMVMTEAMFICLSLAVVVWLDRMSDTGADGSGLSRAAAACVAALLIATAALTRAHGYSYIVMAAAYLWLVGQRRPAFLVGVLSVVFVTPWLVVQRGLTGSWFGSGYLSDVTSRGETVWPLPLRPVENLLEYATRLLPQAITPFFGNQVEALLARVSLEPLLLVPGALVTVATVWGIAQVCRRRHDPAAYLAIALVALMLVWPFRYTRFCLPFLPLCVVGIVVVLTRLPRRLRWGGWVLAGLALVGFVGRDIQMLYAPPRERFVDLKTVVAFLEAHTEPDAVIITNAPEAVAVYSTRRVMDLRPPKAPGSADEPSAAELLRRTAGLGQRYVLVFGALVGEQAVLPAQLGELPLTPVAESTEPSIMLLRLVE